MDSLQQRLTAAALEMRFDDLPPGAVEGAKARLVAALGAMASDAELRGLAAQRPQEDGATVIGLAGRVEPDLAALANAAGLPDAGALVAAVLAAAEHGQADGRELAVALVLAETVRQALAALLPGDVCPSNAVSPAAAAACGRLLGLTPAQLAHGIGLAAVTGTVLDADLAPAMAARAGLFAVLTARAGMEGPVLPFEGKTGWCALVARARPESLDLTPAGGDTPAGAAGLPGDVLDRLRALEDLDRIGPVLAGLRPH